MFLPLMKKALMGFIGVEAKTSLSLAIIKYYSCEILTPPLKVKSAHDEKILDTPLVEDKAKKTFK